MKVMFLAQGHSIHSNNWASAMCDRGHEVHFVTLNSFTRSQYSFVRSIDPRIHVHFLPVSGKKGFLLNGPYLKKLTKKINPDIIHVHQAAGCGFLGMFTDPKKALVSVYGWEVYDLVKNPVWRFLVGKVLHWYRYIGSTSYCMRDQIYKEFPNLKTEIHITPFGIDTTYFQKEKTKTDELIVGTVKKMDEKYGVRYLIQGFEIALRMLRHSHPQIAEKMYLELVGPGKQTDELKQLAKDLGIESRVRFVGGVPHVDVPKWLNRFDIYVALSIKDSESFGVAVIEASACGCCVIVSNVGGLPEVVQQGKTGYIVPSQDCNAVAQHIQELILDENLRTQMGENGIQFVKNTYEWQYCVDLMEDVYHVIMEHST